MMPCMTTLTLTNPPALVAVGHDLYRDIHKGIRAELFAVTLEAGRLDPSNRDDRVALAAQMRGIVDLLVGHAEHEDGSIQPVLEAQLPDLAARIEGDHEVLDARIVRLAELADAATESAVADQRFDTHRLYVELGSFTSAYLAHQDLEERSVMPALEAVLGLDGLLALHQALIAAIAPDELVRSLAVMLPAMNVDDRTELLGGMQANAPAEVFEGIWSLARSVLSPSDHSAVARRLAVA